MLDVGVHPVEPVCPGDVPHVDLCSSNSKPSASIPYLRWSTMCSYSHFLLTHHPLHPIVGGPDVLHQGGLVVSPLLGQTKQREVNALISQKFMKVLIFFFLRIYKSIWDCLDHSLQYSRICFRKKLSRKGSHHYRHSFIKIP